MLYKSSLHMDVYYEGSQQASIPSTVTVFGIEPSIKDIVPIKDNFPMCPSLRDSIVTVMLQLKLIAQP